MRRTIFRRCTGSAGGAGSHVMVTRANLDWKRGDERPDKKALFEIGTSHNGFKVESVTPIEDLRVTVFKFVHEGTGSIVHHIDSNDKNNAFCIGFGTPATSSRGTTHVLEHTVLCGSQKYPVKDPFFHMLRRSLSTFMNAMTGADFTLYPFATMNPQDYQNLLDVYLDAVFSPLLRQDDFRQEGHRVEPEVHEDVPAKEIVDANGEKVVVRAAQRAVKELKFNGVVFNEMLGVISEPPRHFAQELQRAMLPGTHYEHLSGGYPSAVLELTHDEVLHYHRTHYTPFNAVALMYGDLDPRPTLETLNRVYSQTSQQIVHAADGEDGVTTNDITKRVPIPALSQWRKEPMRLETTGPASVMGDPETQSKAIVSFAIPPPKGAERLDLETLVKLTVLETLLTDGPASPMYKALISEGAFGQSYAPMTGFASHYTTPLMSFGVDSMDRNAVKAEQVERAVFDALQKSVTEGFDKRRVDATVFQTELQQRHRSANYGVNVSVGLAAATLTLGGEPVDYLNWLPTLREIQKNPAVLQDLLKRVTLENKHSATVTVHADPEHSKKVEAEIEAKIKHKNEEFRRAVEVDRLVGERTIIDHEEWLKRVNATQTGDDENVRLPSLSVADIAPGIFKEPPMKMVHDGVEIIETEANGLVYVSLFIPARAEMFDPARLDPASPHYTAAMLSPTVTSLVTALGTKSLDFEEFDVEAQLVASSVGLGGTLSQRTEKPDEFIAGNTSGFYTTLERLPAALDLLKRVLLEPRLTADLTDKDRRHLHTMICARAARRADGVQHSGHRVAAMRSYANVSFAASLADAMGGLSQVQFLDGLKRRLTDDDKATAEAALGDVLAAREHRILDLPKRANELGADVWAVCDGANTGRVAELLRDFRQSISGGTSVVNHTPRVLKIDRERRALPADAAVETVELPINASYAATTFEHGLEYMSAEQQALRVGLQLVKSEFLHREVRELGGAYGVMSEATLGGIQGGVAFSSYRDPSPARSLETFKKVREWLTDASNVTQQRVDEAKLRLFASIDHPITCDSFGVKRRLSSLSDEADQHVRDMLLAVRTEDILAAAEVAFDNAKTRSAVLAPRAKQDAAPTPSAEE